MARITNQRKKYLITAECSHTEPVTYGRRDGKTENVLTHKRFKVVNTHYPHHAEQVAQDMQRQFALDIAKALTKTKIAPGPEAKAEVIPCATLTPVTVKVTPEKYKKRHARILHVDKSPELMAKQYAQWLAKRDGIELPTSYRTEVRCQWNHVTIPGETVKRHFWNGTREVQKTENRIKAVEYGHNEDIYNTRKDGKRGAFLYKQFVCDTRIEIPNWDWVASYTEEHDAEPVLEAA